MKTPAPDLATLATQRPDSLQAYWMPFTANPQFKGAPRLLVRAEGMHYEDVDGHRVLDGTAGLWCCNAGHARPSIVAAIAEQAATLDYAPPFQMGSPPAFVLAQRLAALAPGTLNHVFFTNSGSEAVDTAMKIILAHHRLRGEGQRTRFIGREKAYHGVGFGGMAIGGLPNNRKQFGLQLAGTDYLPHTLDLQRNAFSKGLPRHGVELADALERLLALHDPSTVAAVFVEPVAGSAGVILPAAGYLQRLREICDQHGILLVFDEVITGFGRVGMPFAAQRFGVTPDLLTFAKGVSNGAVPLGGVLVSDAVHAPFNQGPAHAIDLFHGYTYSGHPLACAAALATLEVYASERLFERAIELGEYWQERLHALQGLPNVIDIRNFGLVGAVELAPRRDAPGSRGYEVFRRCFHDGHLLVRCTGDTIALSPPLIVDKAQIDQITGTLGEMIRATA
ncbi:aspartate aminotransferase family protein [Stenotrophomonas sp. 24(2023)]|uniref:aspartate aminotransferase family protein n=1 Tax=Stenotrophomonas sp. 24(2023) TaxID=3068324 RepID=UPI0027DF9147|nr:aspartate aminotransferase family protein [Stenotrophomonas sp. 24(2023)]WMJ68556.1 aspartate aminotransferase family protein [Stenotrophomonas sp. 24(2023)]